MQLQPNLLCTRNITYKLRVHNMCNYVILFRKCTLYVSTCGWLKMLDTVEVCCVSQNCCWLKKRLTCALNVFEVYFDTAENYCSMWHIYRVWEVWSSITCAVALLSIRRAFKSHTGARQILENWWCQQVGCCSFIMHVWLSSFVTV